MARVTRFSLSGGSFNALTEHQQTASFAATGQQLQTTVGQITLDGWALCSTSQTPNFGLCDTSQTPNWVPVNDAQ